VTGARLHEAAERRRLAISEGLAPDPVDEALLAGCELGGKVIGERLYTRLQSAGD
jgi:hypothetical protein